MLNPFVLSVAEVHNTMISSMIVVTGSFVLLLVLLKIFAWDSITEILKQREDKIANDLDSAEKSRIEAAQLEEQRNVQLSHSHVEASEIIKDAKTTGEKSRQTIIDEAKQEVIQMKEKADTAISIERQSAMHSIKDEVAEMSIQIAEKILSKELSLENQEALINEYIEGLGKHNEA